MDFPFFLSYFSFPTTRTAKVTLTDPSSNTLRHNTNHPLSLSLAHHVLQVHRHLCSGHVGCLCSPSRSRSHSRKSIQCRELPSDVYNGIQAHLRDLDHWCLPNVRKRMCSLCAQLQAPKRPVCRLEPGRMLLVKPHVHIFAPFYPAKRTSQSSPIHLSVHSISRIHLHTLLSIPNMKAQ